MSSIDLKKTVTVCCAVIGLFSPPQPKEKPPAGSDQQIKVHKRFIVDEKSFVDREREIRSSTRTAGAAIDRFSRDKEKLLKYLRICASVAVEIRPSWARVKPEGFDYRWYEDMQCKYFSYTCPPEAVPVEMGFAQEIAAEYNRYLRFANMMFTDDGREISVSLSELFELSTRDDALKKKFSPDSFAYLLMYFACVQGILDRILIEYRIERRIPTETQPQFVWLVEKLRQIIRGIVTDKEINLIEMKQMVEGCAQKHEGKTGRKLPTDSLSNLTESFKELFLVPIDGFEAWRETYDYTCRMIVKALENELIVINKEAGSSISEFCVLQRSEQRL